ncbi:MAG: phage/plasmid primase, P4 family [Desulfovibrio sp.]|nr:phage/plasmid primase, P4 family [Desulfovibrio sp.]
MSAPLISRALELAEETIPDALRSRPQWVCWRYVHRPGAPKPTKQPICAATGKLASTSDPATWSDYHTARAAVEKYRLDGIGYVFTAEDPFCGIDLDSCLTPEGEWDPWARNIVARLDSYTELSPSGEGLHIIVQGRIQDELGNRRGRFECYDKKQFFTVTGKIAPGLDYSIGIEERQQELDAVRRQELGDARKTSPKPYEVTRHADLALIEKSFGWKNGQRIRRLWGGDWSDHKSRSEADLSLCNHLAFLFQRDASRMDRAFRESGLMRPKWDAVHVQGATYGEATIAKAIAGCRECWGEKKTAADGGFDHLTEDSIALAFAAKFKDDLRFDHHAGKWYAWQGTHWRKEETRQAFDWCRDLCRELNAKGKTTFAKATTASAVERFCQADRAFAVTSEIWDTDPFKLGTPAGTVNLKTGYLLPPQREEYITKQTAVAPDEWSDCPTWKRFLADATRGDEALQKYLQRITGYLLTGSTKEHALFFVYGPGGNGKSVFLTAITEILADYATTSSMETFIASKNDRHPTDLAMLNGARLVSASETEEGRAWAESKIKQMTGGDKITARFMRQDFFTFTPQFKLLIVGNHQPNLHNVDDAMRRRFNMIPFEHQPEQPDPDLPAKLRAEYPGILRWMIEGCLEWQQIGLARPEVVTQATAEYFDGQDVFGQWLEECCEVGAHKAGQPSELFASWKAFAERNGEDAGNAKSFANNLKKRGFLKTNKRVAGAVTHVYSGIALTPKSDGWQPYKD